MLLRCTIVRLGSAAFLAAGFALPAWGGTHRRVPGRGGPAGGARPRRRRRCRRPAKRASTAPSSGSRDRLTLEGEPGAVVLGPGKGNVITVSAPEAVVRGLVDPGLRTQPRKDGLRRLHREDGGARLGRGQQDRGQPLRRLHPRRAGGGRPPERDHGPARRPRERGRATASPCGTLPAPRSSTTTSGSGATASSRSRAEGTCSAATASATCALPSTTCTPTTARSPTTSRSATPSVTR